MASTNTVYNYRIWCNTENAWVTDNWSTVPPTTCKNDTAHVINPNSVGVDEEISPSEVTIKDESPPFGYPRTGHRFKMETKAFDVPGNSFVVEDYVYKFPITVLRIKRNTDERDEGDFVSCYVRPPSSQPFIGVLAATAPVGALSVVVPAETTPYTFVGMSLVLTYGPTEFDCGEVHDIDTVSNTIFFENATTSEFPAGTTAVSLIIRVMNNCEIGRPGASAPGDGSISGTYIPKGWRIGVRYTNSKAEAKRVVHEIEYYY